MNCRTFALVLLLPSALTFAADEPDKWDTSNPYDDLEPRQVTIDVDTGTST